MNTSTLSNINFLELDDYNRLTLNQRVQLANEKVVEAKNYPKRSAFCAYVIGTALLSCQAEIKANLGSNKFLQWLQDNWEFSVVYAYKYMRFAKQAIAKKLVSENEELTFSVAYQITFPDKPGTKKQVARATLLLNEQQEQIDTQKCIAEIESLQKQIFELKNQVNETTRILNGIIEKIDI